MGFFIFLSNGNKWQNSHFGVSLALKEENYYGVW